MSSRVRGYASRDSSPNALPMSEGARHGEPVGLHDLEKSHALREEGTTVTLPVDVSGGGPPHARSRTGSTGHQGHLLGARRPPLPSSGPHVCAP